MSDIASVPAGTYLVVPMTWIVSQISDLSSYTHVQTAILTVDRIVDPGPLVGQLHFVGLGIGLFSDADPGFLAPNKARLTDRCSYLQLVRGVFLLDSIADEGLNSLVDFGNQL